HTRTAAAGARAAQAARPHRPAAGNGYGVPRARAAPPPGRPPVLRRLPAHRAAAHPGPSRRAAPPIRTPAAAPPAPAPATAGPRPRRPPAGTASGPPPAPVPAVAGRR